MQEKQVLTTPQVVSLKHQEYSELMVHIDDLKKICDKLKLSLNLLEIPLPSGGNILKIMSDVSDSESSSDASEDEGSLAAAVE
jgi:hypothetical protein